MYNETELLTRRGDETSVLLYTPHLRKNLIKSDARRAPSQINKFNPETKPTSVELLSIISFNWFQVGSKTLRDAIRKRIGMGKFGWEKLRFQKYQNVRFSHFL